MLGLDHHPSSGVPLFQIPDRLGDFAQRVAPVDHRDDSPGFKQLLHDDQFLFARMRQKWEQVLADQP